MCKENLIYGLDDKVERIKKYCSQFLYGDNEFENAKKKLSIIPTFLFYGFPGTGKTTIAHKVYKQLKMSHNIDLKSFRIDELISYNFGESSKNIIKFFDKIKEDNKKNEASTFVIIDEIDSFTVNRYQNDSESIKRILLTFNNIIDQMFLSGELDKIIIIATTNMRESIDASVLRRFFFHEDFNIMLNKKEFHEFLNSIIGISKKFDVFDKNGLDELFTVYQTKKFTLGEIKNFFAHFYMESNSEKNNVSNVNMFHDKESYYEIVSKQKDKVSHD